MKTLLIVLFAVMISFGQSKTKITMSVEKDSISLKEIAELISDVQKLEKKWKLDIKIEFEKKQEEPKWNFFQYNNGNDQILLDSTPWRTNNGGIKLTY